MSDTIVTVIAALGSIGSFLALLYAIYLQRPVLVPKVEYYLHMVGSKNDYQNSYFFISVVNVGKTTAKDVVMSWRIIGSDADTTRLISHPFSVLSRVEYGIIMPEESKCKTYIDSRINNYTNDCQVLWLEIILEAKHISAKKTRTKLDITSRLDGGLFVNVSDRIAEPPHNFQYLLDEFRKI